VPSVVVSVYTGDGTGTRAITGIGYAPGATWVLGTPSSLLKGAIRFASMPANKSHPWNSDIAAADASRSDRILSLDADGFTVGTDLNANSVLYFHICWPNDPTVFSTGSYVGSGKVGAKNSSLTISGGNNASAAGMGWTASDVGTVFRLVADNSILGTVTAFVNSSNLTVSGGVNGTYAGNTWYCENQTVAMGFSDPDLVMICPGDSIGAPTPACIAPGVPSSMDGMAITPLDGSDYASANTINWVGTGFSPSIAGCLAGRSVFERLTGAEYDKSTVTYHWMAYKKDLSALPTITTVTWTGDGASPRDITSPGFRPTIMFIIGDAASGGGSRIPLWKVDDAIQTADRTGAFLDTFTINSTIGQYSLLSNGFRIEDTYFNISGKNYLALLMASFSAPAGGGGVPLFMLQGVGT
jgi:hypothetical protein